jgi:hypothetical protein
MIAGMSQQNPYLPGTWRYAQRQREIEGAARTAEYNELTGRVVLSETEASAICRAFAACPPVMAAATPSAMTSEGIIEAGEVRRGERHNGRPPPQPQRHRASAREITAAGDKARS